MRTVLLLAVLCVPSGGAVQQDIEYKSVDGKPLKLDASVPEGKGPFPAAILVHGGSWGRGDKRSYVTPLFEPLTAAGYVWFSIDYRQTPEFQFPAPTDDVISAVEWVREHADEYKVDTSRLVLIGESAGGQMVGYVGARYGEELGIAAVVDFYGPNDMTVQGAKTKKAQEHPDPENKSPSLLAEYLGIKSWDEAAEEKMKEASPITYVSGEMPPFLCVHGTADPQVDYSQSVKFCEAAVKAGGKCVVQTVEGGGHGMGGWKGEWKAGVMAWLKKVLE
jgi:alpha-L-fucosidase 2